MLNERYELRYLPLFYKDLDHDISHIIHKLGNPDAARKLIDEVEAAIIRRLEDGPESFEQVSSRKNRNHPYYRIYIKNFVIYYVVLEENGKKIMEVRRFLHKLEDRNSKV
jgi:plasmid stabilization system protein ParE